MKNKLNRFLHKTLKVILKEISTTTQDWPMIFRSPEPVFYNEENNISIFNKQKTFSNK